MAAAKLRTAIVGLGRIASLLEDDPLREKPCTHAGAVAASADCELAGGADTDEKRRRLFMERWKVGAWADAAAMLDELKPDILHIATHPDSHARYCRLAAEKGVRVAVCEKPMTERLQEARELAALHNSKKIKILVNHERRYAADYRLARDIIASGRLGAPLSVRAVLCFGRSRRLEEVLWHDGTHIVDALMFLGGGLIRREQSWGAPLSAKTGTAWLAGRLERGGTAKGKRPLPPLPYVLEVGAGRDHLVFEIEFSCESGRLRIGNGLFEVWESRHAPWADNFNALANSGETFEGPTSYFANMVTDAAACAREASRQPESSANEGLAVVEYLEEVTKNA